MSQEIKQNPSSDGSVQPIVVHEEEVVVSEPSEETVIEEQTPSEEPNSTSEFQSSSSVSTRPKRNARKSVLYNNEDYELQIPGVVKEEVEDKDASSSQNVNTQLVGNTPSQKMIAKRARNEDGTVRGSRKRKTVARLEEEMMERPTQQPTELQSNMETVFVDESILELGAETEIPFSRIMDDDDGPPILNMATQFNDGMDIDEVDEIDSFADDDDFLNGNPPDLEMNLPNKRRGRPRKGDELIDELEQVKVPDRIEPEKKDKKVVKQPVMTPRAYRVQGERVISKTLADRQYNVKLFEDEIEMTENGDCYATVISGCLAYLLRKERIIELLTGEVEIAEIRNGGWMLDKPPRLPPLVQHKACFAFYVDGSKITSIKDISNDDLKPWSSSGDHFGDPVIKPNVRRHPVGRENGRLQICKNDPRQVELYLTEYSSWLPRLLRLRKKIFYLSRDGQVYGNALILYDYTCPGEAPVVVNLPHGNDYLRNAMIESASDPNMPLDLDEGSLSSPFEDELVDGPRGGVFLRVKPSKLGWAQNKKLLLRYLFNEPALLDQTNCLNRRTPFLPPLISTVGVFVYFVPSNFVANQIHHTGDGLSPWTVNQASAPGEPPSPRVRSTRKSLIQDAHGMFVVAKDSGWQQTQLCLVETMSVLARCPRLRKRVIYIQRNNSIILGNVCYIYEYVRDGDIPGPFIKSTIPPGPQIESSEDSKHALEWIQQKKMDTGLDSQGPSTSSNIPNAGDNTVIEEDQYIDVEDIEVVEEEVIGHDTLHHEHNLHDQQMMQPIQQNMNQHQMMEDEILEMSQEDVLNNGYDCEFDDDPLSQQENAAPYFENPRQLDTGHIYLTVRHKRIASSFEAVLEWIANTNVVEERGLLNYAKPGHPPIVRNARAYAFFVAGTAIFPHDINRDDFSPWSHNGNAQNPTCYRTKVRKVGVICDEMGSQFQTKDADYKTCPFHLVFLYSINPREPRLRKKIYYMMETESRLVVSHALIMYDYNLEGELPRMHGGYLKRFTKRTGKRPPLQIHDIDNDVSDISESEKESPFALPAQVGEDGCTYLQLLDLDFWNDRNRQLHYIVNKPSLVEQLGCLNNRVPTMPPATTGKGAFIFFVDGLEVDARNLTCDALVPWSENNSSNPHGVTKRPKSGKHPLALNREGQLRVWKTPSHRGEQTEFQLHVYTATLPRCTRLRKKVSYVLKNGHQIGHAMIIYSYTEAGEMPTPININALSQEYTLQRLPPLIREEVLRLLNRLTPSEVSKVVLDKYGIQVNPKMLYYVRRREIMNATNDPGHQQSGYDMKDEMIETSGYVDEWNPDDPSVPSTSSAGNKRKILHEVLDERDMQVAHTEVIEHQPQSQSQQRDYHSNRKSLEEQHHQHNHPESNKFFQPRNPAQSGMVRGNQRNEAMWRIAKNSFGSSTDTETFDMLFKMLFDKNEQRLLQIVNHTFGVEILSSEEVIDGGELLQLANEGHIVEEIVEEEVVETADDETEQIIDVQGDEEKVFLGKDLSDGMEQVIVEEEVNDQLLEEALVDGVLVEDVDPTSIVMDDHHL
uniref:ULP_PROTEASE domain-containing protein n=1 Tax=Caenorhabditis tropicalis TaxID=1561998 RepID=A0A1I7TED4_9PELO